MSILFYESRKKNDNSTMNFNDQLLSCSFFSFALQGWLQQRNPADRRRQFIGQRRQNLVRLVSNFTRLASNARLLGAVARFLPSKYLGRYVPFPIQFKCHSCGAFTFINWIFSFFLGTSGTKGRTCSRDKGKGLSASQRRSCIHLCKNCGHKVKKRVVNVLTSCNCTFQW